LKALQEAARPMPRRPSVEGRAVEVLDAHPAHGRPALRMDGPPCAMHRCCTEQPRSLSGVYTHQEWFFWLP